MEVLTKILKLIEGKDYQIINHEEVTTSAESAKAREKYLGENAINMGAKAILFSCRKLIVSRASDKLNNKNVRKFGSFEKDLEGVTGCKKGSMPPFGSLFGFETYLDEKFLKNEIMAFNCGLLDTSIIMKVKDYIEIEKPTIGKYT